LHVIITTMATTMLTLGPLFLVKGKWDFYVERKHNRDPHIAFVFLLCFLGASNKSVLNFVYIGPVTCVRCCSCFLIFK
jgi:hypothetical protein